jgi:hypothetical protein
MSKAEELIKLANKLLKKNGFSSDGSRRVRKSKEQLFFEKLIIMTPMGNRR